MHIYLNILCAQLHCIKSQMHSFWVFNQLPSPMFINILLISEKYLQMKSAFKLWSLKKKKKLLFLLISVCTVDSVFHMYNQALLKCFHKKKSDQGVPPVIRQLQYSHYQIHTTKSNFSPWTQYHTLSLIFFFSFLRNFRMSCNLRCLMNQHFLPSLLWGL